MAGSDTTGTALTVILDQLVCHSEIFSNVRTEVDAVVSDSTISIQAIQRLRWLDACVKEAMRLHPSIGMILPRLVPAGGATICGERFSGGMCVGMSAAVVQYDKKVFGEDAGTFNPGRWLNVSAERRQEMENSLIPFGSGPRRCGGKAVSWNM
jgi:cytochrome P450